MLQIHLITLIVSCILGVIFSLTRWKSILIVSILYYGLYVFEFFKALNITPKEYVPAALFCLVISHGPFIIINLIRITYRNPRRILSLIARKEVAYPIISSVLILLSVYLYYNWNEIRCKIQQPKFIDVYTTEKNYYEEIRVINKALHVNELDNNTYDVIRLYFLPSFENEIMVEVRIIDDKIQSVIKYATIGKTVWDDQQAVLYNKHGKPIGGRVKGLDEYVSTVKVDIDTITDGSQLTELNEFLKHTDVFSMSSITRKDENNCEACMILDGNTYVVISRKHQGIINYFEFNDESFEDQRYLRTKSIIKKLAANKRLTGTAVIS